MIEKRKIQEFNNVVNNVLEFKGKAKDIAIETLKTLAKGEHNNIKNPVKFIKSDGTLGDKSNTVLTIIYGDTPLGGSSYNRGSLYLPDAITIEKAAFEHSFFKGSFYAPQVTSIGKTAFLFADFTGSFNAPKVITIGRGAFEDSKFTDSFNAPLVTTIKSVAFYKSRFTGPFNAPNLKSIGD